MDEGCGGRTPRACGRFPPLKRGALEGRTWDAGRALRGKPPRRLRRHPSQEGNLRGTTPAASGGTPFPGRGLF
ncbi:MAG: hypothetical protein LBM98_08830 [Oscillospiraceae bacterium]|nr:hypothetical protein [Oscillospiraceae bacterium]